MTSDELLTYLEYLGEPEKSETLKHRDRAIFAIKYVHNQGLKFSTDRYDKVDKWEALIYMRLLSLVKGLYTAVYGSDVAFDIDAAIKRNGL